MDGYSIFRQLILGTSFCYEKRKQEARRLRKARARRRKKEAKRAEYAALEAATEASNTNKDNTEDSAEKGPTKAIVKKVNYVEEDQNDDSDNQGIRLMTGTDEIPVRKEKKEKTMTPTKLANIRKEKITHFRRVHRIHCEGSDIPDPIENFEQLKSDYNVHEAIMTNIAELGYVTPTPVQMQVLPLLFHKRQALVCSPTGSGKTAAFIIPILHTLKEPQKSGFRALILTPTRELAKQVFEVCLKLADGTNLRPYIIDNAETVLKKPKRANKHDILISTPNRLIYLLQHDPPMISLDKLQWFIVDESDKLFEAGKRGFRDQLATIYNACDSANVKRAMFSATYAYYVEKWCKENLDSIVSVSIGDRNTAVETVKQELLFVGCEAGKIIAIQELRRTGLMIPVLVFVQSRERAFELLKELIFADIRVDFIHAGRSQLERDNVVRDFHAGKIWVLVCTELMGRGIDFKGVKLVINYDFPPSAISYIHRIGRAGRAGEPGKAITFFTEDDFDNLRSIGQVMKNAGCEVPDYILQMKKRKRRKDEVALPIKRARISTVPQYDIDRKAKMKKIIENSKKRKLQKKKEEQASQVSETEQKNEGECQNQQAKCQGQPDRGKGHGPSGRSRGHGPPGRSRGYRPQGRGYGSPGRSRGHGPPGRGRGHGPPGRGRGHGPPGRGRGHGPPGRGRGHGPPGRGHFTRGRGRRQGHPGH